VYDDLWTKSRIRKTGYGHLGAGPRYAALLGLASGRAPTPCAHLLPLLPATLVKLRCSNRTAKGGELPARAGPFAVTDRRGLRCALPAERNDRYGQGNRVLIHRVNSLGFLPSEADEDAKSRRCGIHAEKMRRREKLSRRCEIHGKWQTGLSIQPPFVYCRKAASFLRQAQGRLLRSVRIDLASQELPSFGS